MTTLQQDGNNSSGLLRLSLNAKICVAATVLVVLSLAVTATVIGIKSSASAESAAIELTRTTAREVAGILKSRISVNLAAVMGMSETMRSTKSADLALQREQINEVVKGTLAASGDLAGASVTWEPGALDGKDAEFAGHKPLYDDTGRFMPYWSRNSAGVIRVEPIVFGPKPGDNDWYDVPKRVGKVFFTEPYEYPIDGKQVLVASLAAPIMIGGVFQGASVGDLPLSHLTKILSEQKRMAGGKLSLISNGGMYASHPSAELLGKKMADIPAAGLERVRQGQAFEYEDAQG